MSGMAFYNLKRIRAFVFDIDGVLSPSVIPMGDDGMPMRMVNVKDGYALQLAAKYNYNTAIITGGTSKAVEARFQSLGIKDIYQGVAHKVDRLREWMSIKGLQPEEVLYMGDDIPDLKCMRIVGLPCCPHDAAFEVRETATYISPFSGGYGCARDVIRQVMLAQNTWMKEDTAFGW